MEPAADGPDATSPEYRPGRLYSDGQWLNTGTTEVQLRVTRPRPPGRPARPELLLQAWGKPAAPQGMDHGGMHMPAC